MHSTSMRPRTCVCLLLAAVFFIAAIYPARAAVLIFEDFDTDGLNTRYSAVGAGATGSNSAYWELAATRPSPLTGFEGANYWGGRNLDVNFGGTNQLPRTLTVPLTATDVSLYTDLQVSLLVAANQGQWESSQPDYLRVYAVNADTNERQLLEEFLPTGANASNLAATINSSTVLTPEFQSFTFNITSLFDLDNLQIVFEAGSTSGSEYLGFDELEVTGTLIPEPTAALYLGLGALVLLRRRRS